MYVHSVYAKMSVPVSASVHSDTRCSPSSHYGSADTADIHNTVSFVLFASQQECFCRRRSIKTDRRIEY